MEIQTFNFSKELIKPIKGVNAVTHATLNYSDAVCGYESSFITIASISGRGLVNCEDCFNNKKIIFICECGSVEIDQRRRYPCAVCGTGKMKITRRVIKIE